MRGPLKILKENWLTVEPPNSLLDQVSDLCLRLTSACELAQKNMKIAQNRMKIWYDKKAQPPTFKIGEKVLAFLLLPRQPLQARFCGPYIVTKRVGNVNYIIDTPDRRRTQHLCHINMLKKYCERDDVASVATITAIHSMEDMEENEDFSNDSILGSDATMGSYKLHNSEILAKLDQKLHHLTESQQQQVISLLRDFVDLFPDVPGQTSCVYYDVDMMGAKPIKQHPYHANPVKLQFLRKEVEYNYVN